VTSKRNDKCFMEIEDRRGDKPLPNVAEAILCLWQVNKQGHFKRVHQVSFDYDFPYTPTKDNNMRLTLSHDLKYVSLGLIKNSKVHLMVWNTKDLQ